MENPTITGRIKTIAVRPSRSLPPHSFLGFHRPSRHHN
nr:MAG TPA: hypothetical protein [Caudoviricetes sp.]